MASHNFLSNINFRLNIDKLPITSYFCQRAEIPSVSLQEVIRPSPIKPISIYGDQLQFTPLTVEFLVDEDFTNWNEIYEWMRDLGGGPDSQTSYDANNLFSDASLVVMNSHVNPNKVFNFVGFHPVNLDPISFDSTQQEVVYVTCTATFAFTSMNLTNT